MRIPVFFDEIVDGKEVINASLTFANANLGYSLEQVIIEYVDNAIDANASEISICICENAILIIDNGNGMENVKDYFKVVPIPRKREKDTIGLYSVGAFSAFADADKCSFISRIEIDKKPAGISVYYDQTKGGIENESLREDEVQKWLDKNMYNDAIVKSWKSIVIIENIHMEKNSIYLEDESNYLYARLGQRYLNKILNQSICIKVWDMQSQEKKPPKVVEFVDPTFYNVNSVDVKAFHTSAFSFSISMKEVALKIGDVAVDRYHEKYTSHYNDDISREEFDNEELLVDFFVLQPVGNYRGFIKDNLRYKHFSPGGRSLSTGFYVYRNGIGIGGAAVDKKMQVELKRQEFNRFKAVILSTPAFDELLGINIRKDNFEVMEVLTRLLEEKLKESIINFYDSILDGEKYKAPSLAKCLKNLFIAVDDCNENEEIWDGKKELNVNICEKKEHIKEIDVRPLHAIIKGIWKFADLLTTEIKDMLKKWEEKLFIDEIEYENVFMQANEIYNALKQVDKLYFQDLDNMVARVDYHQSRQVVVSNKYSFLSNVDEPHNEQETVFFLLRILENYDNIAEVQNWRLDNVFAYDTSKGIDFIGTEKEDDYEYQNYVNSVIANCQYLEPQKVQEKYHLLFNYRYSGVEIKNIIHNGMSIGHSLATSRFLIAWKTSIGTDGCINAEDGKYYKVVEDSVNTKGIYTYENPVSKHRIRVIILKEWGRENNVYTVERNK